MDKVIGGQDVLVIEFEILSEEKGLQCDFEYWQDKWLFHFGTTLPYTRQIHEVIQQWTTFFGDEEIVLHAFLRAGHYGAKSYACLDCILRSWRDAVIRTIEDVYDREIAERY